MGTRRRTVLVGYEYVVVDGEKVYTDRLRGFTPTPVPRPRAEDGALLPRDPIRTPDLGEFAGAIRAATGAERAVLEDCYWTLVAESHGDQMAQSWRKECEWLIEHRRRLEAMAKRPALGAYPNWKTSRPQR